MEKTMKHKKGWLIRRILIGLVVLALLLFLLVPTLFRPEPRAAVSLSKASYGDITRTLDLSVRVEPAKKQEANAYAGQTIREVYVTEGQRVQKGERLIQYDVEPLRQRLKDLEKNMGDLEAQMDASKNLNPADFMGGSLGLTTALQAQMGQLLGQLPGGAFIEPTWLTALTGPEGRNFLVQASAFLDKAGKFMDSLESMASILRDSGATNVGKLIAVLKVQAEFWLSETQKVVEWAKSLDGKVQDKETEALRQALIKQGEALTERIERYIHRLDDMAKNLGQAIPTASPTPGATTKPSAAASTTDAAPTPGATTKPSAAASTTDTAPTSTTTPSAAAFFPGAGTAYPQLIFKGTLPEAGLAACAWPLVKQTLSFAIPKIMTALPLQKTLNSAMPTSAQDLSLQMMSQSLGQGQNMLEQLKQTEKTLKKQIEDAPETVNAEFSGLVVKVQGKAGDTADGQTAQVLVYDDQTLQTTYRAGRRDATRLKKGQTVRYSYEGLNLSGQVTYVSPLAVGAADSNTDQANGGLPSGADTRINRSMQSLLPAGLTAGQSEPYVLVRMSLSGPDVRKVLIGFDIDCSIEVGKAEHVLSIPAEALLAEGEHYSVFEVDSKKQLIKKPVTIGLQSNEKAQVLTGLTEGEEVVLNPRAAFKPGQKVNVEAQTSGNGN